MNIKTWQERWDTLGIPKDMAIQAEIDELRAELAALKNQEPVAWRFERPGISKLDVWPHGGEWEPLYLAAGACVSKPGESDAQTDLTIKPDAQERKPTTDWVDVNDHLPEAGGYYLVTVDTDDGLHVDVLMFDAENKNWIHEGEPTYCHSYYFCPTHWAKRPEAAHGIKDHP